MAFPVTHVYFAERIKLDSYKAIKGTLVNDIGYLLPIQRENTHTFFSDSVCSKELDRMKEALSEVETPDRDFYRGYFFHMYVDRLLRQEIFVVSESKHIGLIIRCVQEQYFINQYQDFDHILEKLRRRLTTQFFIPQWKMRVHYSFLRFYFKASHKIFWLVLLFGVTGKVKPWELSSFVRELKRVEDEVIHQTQKVGKQKLMQFHEAISVKR